MIPPRFCRSTLILSLACALLPPMAAGAAETRSYRVRPGDHIFKILMRDFGLTNQQAETLVPEIVRINGIADIRQLRAGQTILVPAEPGRRTASRRQAARKEATPAEPAGNETGTIPSPQPRPETAPPAVREVPLSAPLPPVVPAQVDLHVISGRTVTDLVDGFLELLELKVAKGRIVEAGRESTSGTYVSIKVDRFFVSNGVPYVITLGEKDPFNISLLRLLAEEGYRVVQLGAEADFKSVGSTILEQLQWPYTYGRHQLRMADNGQPREVSGFMLVTAGIRPRQLLITPALPDGAR
jgi:LysM domain-containing protein